MLRGIILAAGSGGRLAGAIGDDPKCLMRLGGMPILERQIRALRDAGVDEIAVVVGSHADRVRRIVGGGVHYVENARFAQTNSLYSLWLARPLLVEGFVVLNCDVLFHPQLLTDLMTARCEAAAVIACRNDGEVLGEEEMKVKVRRGRVIEFSKQMPPEDADGENVGMLKFGAGAARALIEDLDRLVADGHVRDWAPLAFGMFAARRSLYAVPTRGYPWIEIDFADDYERAKGEILPAIEEIPARLAAAIPPQAAVDRDETAGWPALVGQAAPGHAEG